MSNAQAIAFLSFGLIVDSSPATFPIPYNVRVGVDNGNGELGTLTSPAQSNVRLGIQYGGNGNQYTGTLYVTSSGGGESWTDAMRELWEDEVAESEYGCTATYGAFTFRCIKNPIRSAFQMTVNAYDKQADTVIDMLRSDAIANGLYALVQNDPQSKRPIVSIEGADYSIIKMESDDSTQPSIRLSATQKQ